MWADLAIGFSLVAPLSAGLVWRLPASMGSSASFPHAQSGSWWECYPNRGACSPSEFQQALQHWTGAPPLLRSAVSCAKLSDAQRSFAYSTQPAQSTQQTNEAFSWRFFFSAVAEAATVAALARSCGWAAWTTDPDPDDFNHCDVLPHWNIHEHRDVHQHRLHHQPVHCPANVRSRARHAQPHLLTGCPELPDAAGRVATDSKHSAHLAVRAASGAGRLAIVITDAPDSWVGESAELVIAHYASTPAITFTPPVYPLDARRPDIVVRDLPDEAITAAAQFVSAPTVIDIIHDPASPRWHHADHVLDYA